MKIQLTLVFSVFATAASFADVGDTINSLTTLSGKTYHGVTISQMSPDGVFFRHANGAAKVLFSDLPSVVRLGLGYDSKKVEAYEKELSESRERDHLARIARDMEIAKAQASASMAATAQANAAQAQYSIAASQQSSYSYGTSYPVVWGYGGSYGGGWYNDRVASPSYGGRAYYNIKRPMPGNFGGTQFGGNQLAHRSPPYSGTYSGSVRFTNGVPALNSSFVPMSAGRPQPGVRGSVTLPANNCVQVGRAVGSFGPSGPAGGGGGGRR